MNKQYILTIIVFIVLAGITGAVYQFYFRERLETYATNQEKYNKLKGQLDQVDQKFSGTRPEAVLSLWKGAVIPWKDAVTQRTDFFNIKEVYDADPPPEGVIIRFYYETESERLKNQVLQAAAMRNPPCNVPSTVYSLFGSPSMGQLTGVTVTKEDVVAWLQQIRLGCQVTKLLLDANVSYIYDLTIWPKRIEGGMLEMHTAGVSVSMNAQNLFTFLDKMQTSSRFIDVNAIKVSNRYLAGYVDPQLDVQMLITQARFVESDVAAPAPSTGPAGATQPKTPTAPGGAPRPASPASTAAAPGGSAAGSTSATAASGSTSAAGATTGRNP